MAERAPVALILIRHGPTLWNAQGRLQGRSDQPLSEAGLAEVTRWHLPDAVRERRADWHFLSSPLLRARQTAEVLFGAGAFGIEPRLCEMDWGDWEGKRLADLRADAALDMAAHEARGLDLLPPGGESPRAVQARLIPLLERLQSGGRPVCAVTHKGVIRALLALALGWNMTGKAPAKIVPASAQVFALGPGGMPSLECAGWPLRAGAEAPPS